MDTFIGLLLAEISDVIRHPKEAIYVAVLICLWFWVIWPALRVMTRLPGRLDDDAIVAAFEVLVIGGAGTTGLVADRLGRNAILIELNPDYAAMAARRLREDAGMFAEIDAQGVDNPTNIKSLKS